MERERQRAKREIILDITSANPGWSAAVVAEAAGEKFGDIVTRSSVLGVWGRSGHDPKTGVARSSGKPPARRRLAPRTEANAPQAEPVKPIIFDFREPGRKEILPGKCVWIEGDPPDYGFCHLPAGKFHDGRSSSFCQHHHDRAYIIRPMRPVERVFHRGRRAG